MTDDFDAVHRAFMVAVDKAGGFDRSGEVAIDANGKVRHRVINKDGSAGPWEPVGPPGPDDKPLLVNNERYPIILGKNNPPS